MSTNNGWRAAWGSITDPLARFRAMGADLQNYLAKNGSGNMPMAWADQTEWDAYAANQKALQDRWLKTLSPTERKQWDADTAYSGARNRKHMNTGMAITGALIGAGAGAMTLGQLGLLGAAGESGGAAGAAGGAEAGAGGTAGSGSAVEMGFNAGGAVPSGASGWGGIGIPGPAGGSAIPTAIELGGSGGLLGGAAGAAGAGGAGGAAAGSGLLGSLWDLVKDNPGLVSAIGGAVAGGIDAGSDDDGGTSGEPTYPPQPGLDIGALRRLRGGGASGGQFLLGDGGGYRNSGLSRYGAAGGTYTPYVPAPMVWGRG